MGNRVVVRIDEGLGKGNEREAPTVSIFSLPGNEPVRPPKKRPEHKSTHEAPPGWIPGKGSSVTWTQTQEIPMHVIDVDRDRGVAVIEGKIFGMLERYEAVIAELFPYVQPLEVLRQDEVDRCVGDCLPQEAGRKDRLSPPRAPGPAPVEEGESLIERLVCSPQLLSFYRHNFAKRSSPAAAERKLRAELEGARKVRKRIRGKKHRPYLILEVSGRFEVPLWKRPRLEDVDSCYVKGISLLRGSNQRAA
ncbi:MAG: hypothetical protein ACJ76B_05675 [Solirubrobacterales bacterium]